MKTFDWSKLDLRFLKAVVYSSKTDEHLRPSIPADEPEFLVPTLLNICPYPNARFIQKYKHEIEAHLLPFHREEVEAIGKFLNIQCDNYLGVLYKLGKEKCTSSLITAYIRALWAIGEGREIMASVIRMDGSASTAF